MQSSAEGLPEAIERQAAAGVAEADCIVLVMDGQVGLTGTDEEIASWLRRSHPTKPVILAINKCENPQKADLQVGLNLLVQAGHCMLMYKVLPKCSHTCVCYTTADCRELLNCLAGTSKSKTAPVQHLKSYGV